MLRRWDKAHFFCRYKDMDGEILRLVDMIHHERSVDMETIFSSLESALCLAVKKHFKTQQVPDVRIDRKTGKITAICEGREIDPSTLGRIAAHAVKQVMMQKISEAETDTILGQLGNKKHDIIACRVTRLDGPHVISLINKADAIMFKGEQIPGESYRVGDQFRAYVLDIERKAGRVRLYLSRACDEFVRRLLEIEIPEIANGTILIKGLAREPGYRSKVMVQSVNPKVDSVGACLGMRGTRIKNIVDELRGENIDIVPWSSNPAELIGHALKPAEIAEVVIDQQAQRARVSVLKDQLSQCIGKGGRNVRLASKLTGWEIDIIEFCPERLRGTAADPSKTETKTP